MHGRGTGDNSYCYCYSLGYDDNNEFESRKHSEQRGWELRTAKRPVVVQKSLPRQARA